MLSHVDPQACIAGRRDEYKAPPNEATYVCLGKRSNDLGDVFTHAIYVLGMSLSFFMEVLITIPWCTTSIFYGNAHHYLFLVRENLLLMLS